MTAAFRRGERVTVPGEIFSFHDNLVEYKKQLFIVCIRSDEMAGIFQDIIYGGITKDFQLCGWMI